MKEGIFARYQEKGITIDEMKEFRSCDTDLKGTCEKELPGLTAADNASYLAFLIAQSVRNNPDRYRSKKDLNGEVVIFFGKETGTMDKDDQPVVKPEEIITRMNIEEFVNWNGIMEEGSNYAGKDFPLVQDVLAQSNGKEDRFQKKMRSLGIDQISKGESR